MSTAVAGSTSELELELEWAIKAALKILRTNADALRAGLIPCETEPSRGGLARTTHPFHGVASVTVGSFKGNKRHVCEECADKWHKHQERKGGVRWD